MTRAPDLSRPPAIGRWRTRRGWSVTWRRLRQVAIPAMVVALLAAPAAAQEAARGNLPRFLVGGGPAMILGTEVSGRILPELQVRGVVYKGASVDATLLFDAGGSRGVRGIYALRARYQSHRTRHSWAPFVTIGAIGEFGPQVRIARVVTLPDGTTATQPRTRHFGFKGLSGGVAGLGARRRLNTRTWIDAGGQAVFIADGTFILAFATLTVGL